MKGLWIVLLAVVVMVLVPTVASADCAKGECAVQKTTCAVQKTCTVDSCCTVKAAGCCWYPGKLLIKRRQRAKEEGRWVLGKGVAKVGGVVFGRRACCCH
jgi:hypothetical protein